MQDHRRERHVRHAESLDQVILSRQHRVEHGQALLHHGLRCGEPMCVALVYGLAEFTVYSHRRLRDSDIRVIFEHPNASSQGGILRHQRFVRREILVVQVLTDDGGIVDDDVGACGLGLLDVRTIFGETAVRPKMKLRLIAHLDTPAEPHPVGIGRPLLPCM